MNEFDFSTTLFYPRTTPYSILITSLVIQKKKNSIPYSSQLPHPPTVGRSHSIHH